MFLKNRESGDLVQLIDMKEVMDPYVEKVSVRFQAGEEVGDPVTVVKTALVFPSGEPLPACWLDAHYRISFDPV
ncbi:MAG: acetyltransferase [Mariprofundus sp.]|nr:acetyltransferase [Mariprofundus sp.]